VIEAVPVDTAITNPVLLTVAIAVELEDHVAELVTSLVELSENVAVAVSCAFCPDMRLVVEGDTETLVTV